VILTVDVSPPASLEYLATPMRTLTASLALMLYLGPLLGQTLCTLQPVGPDAVAPSGVAHQAATGHHSVPTVPPDSEREGSHHGEHSGSTGQAGFCPMATCGAAVVAVADHFVLRDAAPGGDFVTSVDGLARPGPETEPPPPRLG
jgi:hypothetical protein